MSISIVTFADLGKRTNLKTVGILPIIEKLAEENLLEQVICRRTKDFYFQETLDNPIDSKYLIERAKTFSVENSVNKYLEVMGIDSDE